MDEGKRLTTLDALRGVAAMLVVLFHMGPAAPLHAPGGFLAVDLFFALSGFVLARAYDARLKAGMPFAAFMRLRLRRVYPLYLVGAWTGLVLFGGSPAALLLVPDLSGGDPLYPMNVAMWSLLLELVVNAAYALSARWMTPRMLVPILLVAAAALIRGGLARGDLDAGGFWSNLPLGLARTVFGFGLGVILCHLRHRDGRPATVTPLAWLLPLVLVVLLTARPDALAVWNLACALVFLPAIVWLGSRWELPAPHLGALLGDMSYPLYCVHMPVVFVIGAGSPQRMAMLVVILPLAAVLLDRFYDRPLRRLFASRRRSGPDAQAKQSVRRASA